MFAVVTVTLESDDDSRRKSQDSVPMFVTVNGSESFSPGWQLNESEENKALSSGRLTAGSPLSLPEQELRLSIIIRAANNVMIEFFIFIIGLFFNASYRKLIAERDSRSGV